MNAPERTGRDAEPVWPDGIDDQERADLLAALIEAHGLRDFTTDALEVPQTAQRLLTVECDQPHPRSPAPPELAFVYSTSRGLLLEATVHGRHDRSSGSGGGTFEPVPAQAMLFLLERTCPDDVEVQCRDHGRAQISAAALRAALETLAEHSDRAPTLRVPLGYVVT